jgi:ADP-heptose:LPS heptosyltransferase
MRAPALDLAGGLTLHGLTGLLADAAVVISNDTGPLHLAAAVGAPTVGIYWCGNVINAGPFSRARQRPVLSWRLNCSTCGANTMGDGCKHRSSFVDLAATDEVICHALDLAFAAGPWQEDVRGSPPYSP